MTGIRISLQAPTRRSPLNHHTMLGEPPGTGAAWRRIALVALAIIGVCMLLDLAVRIGRQTDRVLERGDSLAVPLRLP